MYTRNITVLNMTAILSQVNGNLMGPSGQSNVGRTNHLGIKLSTLLAQSGHVININS
jgi:hypothetical protein